MEYYYVINKVLTYDLQSHVSVYKSYVSVYK